MFICFLAIANPNHKDENLKRNAVAITLANASTRDKHSLKLPVAQIVRLDRVSSFFRKLIN